MNLSLDDAVAQLIEQRNATKDPLLRYRLNMAVTVLDEIFPPDIEGEHVIDVEGPLEYPGGKDNMYRAVCSCGRYRSPLSTKRQAEKSGQQHVEAYA